MDAFQLKITIKHSHPPIYRRILIPTIATFENLDTIIEELFGWTHEHLWEFHLPTQNRRITNSFDPFAPATPSTPPPDTPLKSYLSEGTNLQYTYDFTDNWQHEIQVEKQIQGAPGYAQVIKSQGDYLIEDCGGITAYQDIIEEAEKFDQQAANESLKLIPIGRQTITIRSLADILIAYKKPELLNMAKTYNIQKCQALNKSQLANRISAHLMQEDQMRTMLKQCSSETIRLINEAIAGDGITCEEETVQQSPFLCSYGVYMESGIYLIPNDVQKLYSKISTPEFLETCRRHWQLMQYCSSAVYLYGVIPLKILINIYDHYEPNPITEAEFEETFKWVEQGSEYRDKVTYKQKHIMHDSLARNNEYRNLIAIQQDTNYYIPEEKEEFLKYGRLQSQTPNNNTMFFLKYANAELDYDFEQACILFFAAQELIRTNQPNENIQDYIAEHQLPTVGKRALRNLGNEIDHLRRYIRHWKLRGFTLEEMYPIKSKVIPFRSLHTTKSNK